MRKYIFIVGGVMSSVGKGVATASIAKIMQSKGYNVTALKADPYINIDAGTMNPIEHGEVFVTEDGDETDQDIGNYERFLNQNFTSINYMTTGRVYRSVIEKERNLYYKGKCVEVVPHIPEEIIERITKASNYHKADITMIEVGGTVGEYQNILFLEAARMMKLNHPKDVVFVLVSYLPIPSKVGEMKTKPTQYAARTLNSAGIQADFIICRSEKVLDKPRREKLATFCGIDKDAAISAPDVDSIYKVPIDFDEEEFGNKILKKLGLPQKESNLSHWKKLVHTILNVKKEIKIGIVGKYFETGGFTLADSYISVIEAIKHACWHYNLKPSLEWINAEDFEKSRKKLKMLKQFNGIIVPGGFGARGAEGKILTAQYCRVNNIPYLGLCFGLQIAVIEFARNVAGLKSANSEECDPLTKHPVIHIMPEQKEKLEKKDYGGSMRLGSWPCQINPKSKSFKIYKQKLVMERHRHRYEVNNFYRDKLEAKGLIIAGASPDNKLVEMIEIPKHKFMVGAQFHPEFKSRPLCPHPLFREFINVSRKK